MVEMYFVVRPQAFDGQVKTLREGQLRDDAIQEERFNEAAAPEHFAAPILVEAWRKHLRQQERTTVAKEPHDPACACRCMPPVVRHRMASHD